jgi:hypothetical protein
MKKKTGRPRKRDNSKFLENFSHMAGITYEDCGLTEEQARELEKSLLIVDPLKNDLFFSAIFAASIAGIANKQTQQSIGSLLADALYELNAIQLKELFDRILNLKVQSEKCHNRAVHAHQAFYDFKKEFGFEPTRQRLKDFMQNHSAVYLNLPDEGDSHGWSDMFNRANLPKMDPGYMPLNKP